jgi:serine/threonine protein kinase/tetratricopeptide (TPR) repeat protein
MEGRHFGSYRIVARLGAGGMGEVYRAHDEKLQRDVAIKVLPAASVDDPLAAARLLREARAAGALNHPNICTVHEVGEHEGETFIAMELVDGVLLHRAVPDTIGLPVDRVVDYGLQIAEALSHAHERGVLHRDLKTANVLLMPSGRVKVLDFGLAKRIVVGPDAGADTTNASLTIGLQAGTPAYLSPEQLRGRPADARSDVWAFGVMLYELAAGQRPFEGDTLYELSAAILNAQPRPLPSRVPPDLRQFIEACLVKDPAQRIQTAEDTRRALQAIRDGRSPATIVPSVATARPRRAVTPTVAAALAILALVAAAAVALRDGEWRNWIGGSAPRFDSIAVLPLADSSGGGDHVHVSVGIHQALTSELAQLQGFSKVVSVASTRRYANSTVPPTDIARALGVKALVTGSIARVGDELQIAAQLVDGADGREVWGQSYRRKASDLIALQNDVVAAIAQAIELRLRPADRQRLAARATISPETYELYLRGMHAIRNADDGDAKSAGLDYFQQAIDRDPGDPHAYAGLASGFVALGHSPAAPPDAWIKGRAAAERAITLAPGLAEAHSTIGQVKMYYEWDWDGAERAFRRANDLNPNMAGNHYHYAWLLFLFGRLDEAIAEHERARDLDPLTPRNGAYLAPLYVAAGRRDDALAVAQKAIEGNPRSGLAWQMLGFVYSSLGRHDEAIEACRRAVEFAPPWTFTLAIAYALAGRVEEARAVLQTMLKRQPTSYGMWARSMAYLYLGDADGFFTSIAYEPHHGFAPWVRVEPTIERFKDDPRYGALFSRFKLPLPAESTGGKPPASRAPTSP